MTVTLDDEDWERVLLALAQFAHNAGFRDTRERLLEQLGRPAK